MIRSGWIRTLVFGFAIFSSLSVLAKSPFPDVKLPKKAQGDEAIKGLGAKLPEVAKWYKMSPEVLTEIVKKDKAAWIDQKGRLFMVDQLEVPKVQNGVTPTGPGTPLGTDKTPLDLTKTFFLHSRPASKKKIYLDFNGHVATNTAWSSTTINASPYDIDGIPDVFSDQEKTNIQLIWKRVSEDYAPFDIDVTTEEPASDAMYRLSTSDDTFGTRVVVTKNTFYSCSCGGVAYVGIFNDVVSTNPEYMQPAWVFANSLGNGNVKYVAEAISHESGHNLGLSHDGTSTITYYQGHGSGATAWAPIMGNGYYRELTQWSKGEYPDANNKEDDFAIMQANGASFRVDDYGNVPASAAVLNGSPSAVDHVGFIEQTGDVDFFTFYSGAGNLALYVNPSINAPNLDISARLFDVNGVEIPVASSNPPDTLNAVVTALLPSEGTYYLKVEGVGKGDLITGYSNYSSLGEYRITGTYQPSINAIPIAVANANLISGTAPLTIQFSSNGSIDPDGSIVSYLWDFGDGTNSSELNPSHIYKVAGNFNATLSVFDNAKAKASVEIPVAVNPDLMSSVMSISNISISWKKINTKKAQCIANVSIKTPSGSPVSGAMVSAAWSGLGTTSASIVTNTSGVAVINSGSFSPTAKGTCSITVKDITLSGFTYDPNRNSETTDSLTF